MTVEPEASAEQTRMNGWTDAEIEGHVKAASIEGLSRMAAAQVNELWRALSRIRAETQYFTDFLATAEAQKQSAVAKEREACAELANVAAETLRKISLVEEPSISVMRAEQVALDIAIAIRSRGEP